MAAWPHPQPATIAAKPLHTLPSEFRELRMSDHSRNQKRGRPLESFLEGPIIVPGSGTLYCVDIPFGRIFAVDLATGTWRVAAEYDGEPNGLAWHPHRRRILIADYKRGIMSLDPATGAVDELLTRFNGEHFKGPNDLVVAGDGSVFFTDQGMTGLQDPTGRVFRLAPDGRLDVLIRNGPSPNGLVLNAKEDTLFVAMTRDNSIWCVPLYPDGSAQRTGRFSSYYCVGGPDGITLDSEGNVFVAHSTLGTVFVHRPNGEPLAQIKSGIGIHTTNMTWGGPDMKTLYVTESETGTIMTVDWHCPGWLGKAYEAATAAA
jgi:gluconolactonase